MKAKAYQRAHVLSSDILSVYLLIDCMGLSKISLTNQENFVIKLCTIKMFSGTTDMQTNAFTVKSMQTNAFTVKSMHERRLIMQTNAFTVKSMQTNAFTVKSMHERRLIISEMDSLINSSPGKCYYKIFIEIRFFHYSPILRAFWMRIDKSHPLKNTRVRLIYKKYTSQINL